ncbi:MAG: hypothetical protein Q9195_007496 [Heterodermia aff. obscurata]
MPLYQIQHSTPLSQAQQDQLAATITSIHTQKFTTPSLFVNVTFTDTSSQPAYVAGKRSTGGNRILAHVRHGPSRTQEDYNLLCASISSAWNEIVAPSEQLHTIFILGDIVAGYEHGMAIPPAGGDREWLRENIGVFRERARGEGEPFGGLVRELEERADLRGIL